MLGGIAVGLLSVVLAALAAWFFLLPPGSSAPVAAAPFALLACAVVAVLILCIGFALHALSTALQKGHAREAELAERARGADELRLWSDVFHNAAFAIAIADPLNNTFRLVNQAYAALHGRSVGEMQGTSASHMYPPAERDRVARLLAQCDRDGHIDYEADRIRADDTTFPAQVHITSVRGVNGQVLYRITTVQDVTRERQLEAELHQAQRLEAIGQLTAGVAHDFNNLLQAAIANLELTDDIDLPPPARAHVASALGIIEQGGALTHRLLSFARRQPLSPREIAIDGFLDRFVQLLSRTLDPRIRIDVVTPPDLGSIWVDESHLQNALLNLAINARDAMPSGGDLRIEASDGVALAGGRAKDAPHGCILIRISDTGCGIAPRNLPRICDPFFSTKGLNGTGLGLSMVYGFAKQSGGDLRIASELGKGTTVDLWLPLAPAL